MRSDQIRLIIYVIMLLVVVGGMMYLKRQIDEVPKSVKPVEAETVVTAPEPFVPTPFQYENRDPSRDGTGKMYMGRKISQVMGHTGINWLERSTREGEEAPGRAVKGLALAVDAVVADIGSGSGYYTFRIAPLVPEGKVIGVDIQPEMVAFLAEKAQRLEAVNVESHLGKVDDVQLPAASIDAAILVDAYHEFSHPNEMMQSIVHALRAGGKVYLLEYRAEDPDVPIKPLHKMTQAQAIVEMKAVGLRHVRTEDFLPWQHFMVFVKPR